MKVKVHLLFSLILLLAVSACQFGNIVVRRNPGINDYQKFPRRDMHANNKPFIFPKAKQNDAKVPDGLTVKGKGVPFDKYLSENNTTAFLIIHNDTLIYEKYFGGYDSASVFSSFAIANVFTSALIGCAIDEGLIQSVDQPVTDFVPELARNGFGKVTIKHLLQMTSGLDFKENYSDPFAEAAIFYYGSALNDNTVHLTLKREPGLAFDYTSGSMQILGMILERVFKGVPITHYFEKKVWFPLETEFDASWSIDKNDGIEKMFCCVNARARDFAKFARLYLNKGNWNGKQIISSKWVNESIMPDVDKGGAPYFKYQWWLMEENGGSFYAEGMLGQYIYINPSKKLIIVRFGKDKGIVNWQGLFANYAATVK